MTSIRMEEQEMNTAVSVINVMELTPTGETMETPSPLSIESMVPSISATPESEYVEDDYHPNMKEDAVTKSKRDNKNILFLCYILGSICYAGVQISIYVSLYVTICGCF